MRFRTQVALIFTAFLFGCSAPMKGPAEHVQTFVWDYPDIGWFGGISGIEIIKGGAWFVAITDRSFMFAGPIYRQDGKITAIAPRHAWGMQSSKGVPLIGRLKDSEGLVIAPDGSAYVSFEGVSRIAHYPDFQGAAIPLRRPPWFRSLPGNGGMESLAMDARGRLFAIPEDRVENGRIPVYVLDGTTWSRDLSLPVYEDFQPVGSDFGPDGRFYLLERAFGLRGFRSRLTRWTLGATGFEGPEVMFESPHRMFGNMEGLAIWRDNEGRLRALVVEDDNFWYGHTTKVAEFLLPN